LHLYFKSIFPVNVFVRFYTEGSLVGVQACVEDDGIDVNAPGASERRPLHRAAAANHVSIINYLVKQGAQVDITDKTGKTALHWAAMSGSAEACEVLVREGADMMVTNRGGKTPAHFSVETGRDNCLSYLLTAGRVNI